MNKFREYKIIYECISLPMNAIETETETERDGKRQKNCRRQAKIAFLNRNKLQIK